MARRLPPVDIVIVGMGWTGGLLARDLGPTGLKIAVLERGGPRSTEEDFSIPSIRDELRFAQRHDLMADTSKDTVTVRNHPSETALPMRRLGSFLPGEGVGGAGVHWNGHTWRWGDNDLKVRSRTVAAHGAGFIPNDMPLRDWGVSYDELEPYYDRFEYLAGVSGKAGNLKGTIQSGGNPFEAPRARDYPLPPLVEGRASAKFREAASGLGYHPFTRPTANASKPYVNPDGMRLGQCQYCGFCERFGCESNAKGSPHITVIPVALKHPNVELRTWSWVQKVMLDKSGKRATGVAYVNVLTGEELEQPADLVALCAYGLSNVHLMLLSGIGKPYDPQTGRGVVGSHYAYQGGAGVSLFFEGESFNPFMAAGGSGAVLDDFHTNPDFDAGPLGFVGGYTVTCGGTNGRPISYRPTPPGTPRWGAAWKRATAKWYHSSLGVGASAGMMPHRFNYLDLDPTYRNRFGQPLMRMTFDFKPNDIAMGRHGAKVCAAIGKAMNPTIMGQAAATESWSVVPYQTTHNTGGAIMGADPRTSAVNTWLQSWDVSNVFVLGASAFPHNSAYNPTGPVAALALRTGEAIRDRYLKRPGLLA
jgi:gluconate 2-dehydrogenase alpha chain